LNSNYRYYYRNARNKSLQERHCPNIDELNLDGIHPSKGPYLGTISWEPQSPMDCTKSLLDLSHHDPHEEQGEEDDDVVENDLVVDVVVDVVGNDDNPYNTTHLLEKRVMDEGEIVGNPVPSWQTVSPIPASSSPLAYTVVQAKHPSDLIISTCTPSESGNEIEISFIPPKRLFQESFTDLDNHDCDHHHNHHVAQKASPHKDASTTPCQSTILSTSNDTMKKIQHKSIAISNGILYHPQHKELEDAPPAPPPSSSSISPSQHHNATTTSSITIQSSETDGGHASSLPDGVHKWGMMHINTLPSFQHGRPIRLNMKESYRGYETRVVMGEGRLDNDDDDDDDNHHDVILDLSNLSLLSDATQQEHFFSYDPYFSLGQYVITTLEGGQYGNGLCVQMGERYMTLQDQNERVWGVIRSRHTWIPSAVIYSPKQRFCGQVASSHRPLEHKSDDGGGYGGVELYPWALVKKHGRRMDHDVTIHMVAEPNVTSSFELLGGLFEKKPMFRSRHGFDGVGNHQSTVVYRVARDDGCGVEREYPCCKSVRNATQKDLFHVTIAPGIDPLLIICYMAAHSKMVSCVAGAVFEYVSCLHVFLSNYIITLLQLGCRTKIMR
jgi:hypothetical protein